MNASKAFIEYSNYMDNIYKNIEEYKPNKKSKILIVSDDMIADILSNKNLNPIVTKLFIRSRKVNVPLIFISQSYLVIPFHMVISTWWLIMVPYQSIQIRTNKTICETNKEIIRQI